MFRLWGKLYKNNRIAKDHVAKIDQKNLSKQEKADIGLEEICQLFDLEKPLWFEDNHKHFEQFNHTSFKDDHFMDSIDFDYLEIELIEDDKKKC